MSKYTEDTPTYAHIMTVDEFKTACEDGSFIDYDGFGHPVKGGKMIPKVCIYPSFLEEIPKDATHIAWFNK